MENRYSAVGKRKNAIVNVILKPGNGGRSINGREINEYLRSEVLVMDVEKPFKLIPEAAGFDMVATANGGGLSGQSGALRLGISRALATISEDNRKILRKNGLLTRDSRIVERKKYGQKGARRRFQFSKR